VGTTITTGTGAHPLTRLAVANIDAQLKAQRMSWNALAEVTDRAPSGLSFIRQGRRGIPLDTLDLIAKALAVEPWLLLRPVPPCPHCGGRVPPGFMCLHCGTTG
jgi:transcriptional regulator with XRE-family HTH domain